MTRYEYLRIYRKTTQGQPVDIALEQAFWRAGWLNLKGLEAVATQLMVEGYDSPTLVQLAAGLADSNNVEKLVDRAMTENGCDLLSVEASVKLVALHVASDILTRVVQPEDGASLLAKLWHVESADSRWSVGTRDWLDGFYYLDDVISDLGGVCTDDIRQEIIAEAKELLEAGESH